MDPHVQELLRNLGETAVESKLGKRM